MRPMINSLVLLYALLFNNFGLSIIVFTVLIRILMVPLTIKQMRQMKMMAGLQPKMKALQAKYAKRKDRESRAEMSRETMRMYREAGVNPIGCLGPMVIQMPIWIGLYRAMFRTVPPTPEGMANLSNSLYAWNPASASVPLDSSFLGMNLVDFVQFAPFPYMFLLPVLVGASMWLTQKMTMMPAMDPKQAQMNQMMLWMLPIMFAVFTWSFPAGLAVYILGSNVIGIVIQYFVLGRRFIPQAAAPAPQPAAAPVNPAEVQVAAKEMDVDGSTPVLRQNGQRGDGPRPRGARRKSRRRRNQRR